MENEEKIEQYNGALIDERSDEEKQSDYVFGEVVPETNPVEWKEKPQSEWRKFEIYNQDGSGSCVAQTAAKLLDILRWLLTGEWKHHSASHIYQRRANKPYAGMGAIDCFTILQKGVCSEEEAPSQNMTDEQMDAVVVPDNVDLSICPNYISLPIQDIDTIASVIQTTKKGLMIWLYFDIKEWTEVPTIKNEGLTLLNAEGRHSVTAVDFTIYNGEKALIIDDSWGTSYGKAGQRVITESFFKKRNYYAGYPISFKYIEGDKAVEYTFNKPLIFIPWDYKKNQPSNVEQNASQKSDVVALQNVLRDLGFFPKNILSTGYYGSITAGAVYKFQVAYEVDTMEILNDLKGRRVGKKTLAVLNNL